MKKIFSTLLVIVLLTSYSFAQQKPNVLIIYVDDLGYGDLSCYGANAINTPNVDWLAAHGRRFTNAHCTASTCTPSRYSLMSGEYAWRKKGTNILPGDANLIVPTEGITLPRVFQNAGYATGVIGKWHLGLGNASPIDWNKPVTPSPNETGFDYSFIFPATADRTPTVFMENHNVLALDSTDPIEVNYKHAYPNELTGKNHPEMLKMKNDPNQGHDGHIVNGIGRIGFMKGGKRAEWTDEELGNTFNAKAFEFIDRSVRQKKPFFLYYAIHNIHVPRMPGTQFKGKSKLGYRGDAILEMDYTVGRVLEELRLRKMLDNTIIIFSSDNGPVLNDGYLDQSAETAAALQYKPAGTYRGGKYSVLEGGTRVPFIVYWDKHIKPNTATNVLFSQVDLMASFANMFHQNLITTERKDSRNCLETLLGTANKSVEYIIEQPANNTLAIVKDDWKYISPSNGRPFMEGVNIETGYSKEDQLYNLKTDPQEQHNLAQQQPKVLEELKALLLKVEKSN